MINIKIDIKIIIMIKKNTQPIKIFPSYYIYMSFEMESHVRLFRRAHK